MLGQSGVTCRVASPQVDPQLGAHRGRPIPSAGANLVLRSPSAQEPRPSADDADYPYDRTAPSRFAAGQWQGLNPKPRVGYSPLDGGPVPHQIPRLWRDGTRYWDGLEQHGFSQQRNGVGARLQLRHITIGATYPSRGIRSLRGTLAPGGPTASRRHIPSVFIPTAVS